MSHQVTITRTTTTTTTSAILLNTGYMKSWSGLLKVFQTILGAVCLGIVGYYVSQAGGIHTAKAEFFFMLISTSFLIGSFCLLLACILSLTAGAVISKTLYEIVFHSIAFVLYLAASIVLLTENSRYNKYRNKYEAYYAASIIGLVVSALYLLSTILAFRHYRLP